MNLQPEDSLSKRKRKRFREALPCHLVAFLLTAALSMATTLLGCTASDLDTQDKTIFNEEPTKEGQLLPFRLIGVPTSEYVIEAKDEAAEDPCVVLWSFGGDYSEIGSFPLNESCVFGSASDTPDDVSSYAATLIEENAAKPIEDARATKSSSFVEPQDGSGTEKRVIWRSGELSYEFSNGIDNWIISTWDAASDTTRVLGTAKKLNGDRDTPALSEEIIPTCNDTTGFFASAVYDNEKWSSAIIAFDLASSNNDDAVNVVAPGSYPAAVPGGVLFATTSDSSESPSATEFDTLAYYDGNNVESLIALDTGDEAWSISGIWACEDTCALSLTSPQSENGSYIAIWTERFKEPIVFIHTDSQGVLGSINPEWFVWGCGSQADNASIYAYRIADGALRRLGDAPGYSRPRIAEDNNTVLIPVVNALSPATFNVGTLD